MSRKIRLGNDIDTTWSLLDKDEQPYIVEGRDFAVEIHIGKKRFKISNAEASGNSIHFIYYGKDQKVTGPATLVYIENGGRVDMVTFDTKDVFTMVEHSWLAVDSDEQPETVTLDVVTVLSNLQSSIGPRGYSAYEIAVHHGYTGTEEEWLDSLKPHITADADGNVYCDGVLLTDVIYRVVSAVTADEQERQEAETARRTAETARVEAETARQTAEGARAEAETARETAESGRQTAETQRSEDETTRQSQETARQNAEQTRQSNESTRQSQETARVNAEQNRTTEFNGLKSDMQTAIQQADAATAAADEINRTVQQNEAARQQAESGRAAAETQRQTAETQRGTNESTRQTQETARETAETSRQTAETTRGTNENARQTAEAARSSAENTRQSSEASRRTAETAREEQSTSDHQRAESDHAIAAEDHATLDEKISHKADIDGSYDGMAVGSAKTLAGNDTRVEDFVFKALDCADGLAKLNSARGKSLVWNQQVVDANIHTTGTGNLSWQRLLGGLSLISGHKYLVGIVGKNFLQVRVRDTVAGIVGGNNNASFIYTAENTTGGTTGLQVHATLDSAWDIYSRFIDLTLMFGAGNEPATVEEFEAMFPLPYYDYNAGEIISNKTEEVKVTGFNQWDEDWEAGGIDTETGNTRSQTGVIRTKNFIPVIPNTDYYLNQPIERYSNIRRVYFYDAAKNFIEYKGENRANTAFNTGRASYIKAIFAVTTYANDICINLSDPARNGEYEPYKTNTIELNLPTFTGKLNGEGESVVVFPDGLKSAGSVYDEIVGNKAIKRVGMVDMGTLTWTKASDGNFYTSIREYYFPTTDTTKVAPLLCPKYETIAQSELDDSKDKFIRGNNAQSYIISLRDRAYTDVATLKASLSGVILYYELATPEEYILDAPLPDTFQAYKGGTIKQLPENGSAPVTAPMVMLATYAIDIVGAYLAMPKEYLNVASLDNLLSTLGSALNGTITKSWNDAQQRYTFTFTPSN